MPPLPRKAAISLLLSLLFFNVYITFELIETDFIKSSNSNEHKLELVEPISKECWRRCPMRPNKIYVALDLRQAGISDRISIINNLAQLAGYLCATLILPSTSSSLAPIHNDNTSISEGVHWKDFINLTYIEDSSPVISHSVIEKLDDYVYIKSKDKDALKQDYTVVQSISWHQSIDTYSSSYTRKKGFVWEIYTDFNNNNLWNTTLPRLAYDIPNSDWFSRPENQPYLSIFYHFHPEIIKKQRRGCMYTNFEIGNDGTPSHLKILRQRLLERIYDNSARDPILIFLHLRRGDLYKFCDTSLEKLRKLVGCSFDGMEDLNRNITMLLGSDERDEGYRNDVMQMVEDEVPYVKVLDVDNISRKIVREAVNEGLIQEELFNNYYIFLLQEDLRGKIVMRPPNTRVQNNFAIYLKQHARGCRNCFNIKKRYSAKLKAGL